MSILCLLSQSRHTELLMREFLAFMFMLAICSIVIITDETGQRFVFLHIHYSQKCGDPKIQPYVATLPNRK